MFRRLHKGCIILRRSACINKVIKNHADFTLIFVYRPTFANFFDELVAVYTERRTR